MIQNLSNSTLHFRCHHLISFQSFPGQGAGALGEGTQGQPGGIFLLSASGNEADDPRSLKNNNKTKTNPSNLSKKNYFSL